MNPRRTLATLAAGSLLLGAGCAGTPQQGAGEPTASGEVIAERILYTATTWSGSVRLTHPLIVTRTATLTLRPGTRVQFEVPEPDPTEDRQPWILVLGSLVAIGSPERPIVFSATPARHNELDDMIQFQEARESHFRHCVFEGGPWALHIHQTAVDIAHCVFRNNYGGLRFQGGPIAVRDSWFDGNRIGVRCLRTSPVIEGNTFVDNLTGVFFREGVESASIRRNHFDNREYDIKLGESQVVDVRAAENYWSAAAGRARDERIYDGADSAGVGRVLTEPALTAPWPTQREKR